MAPRCHTIQSVTSPTLLDLHAVAVLACAPDGPVLRSDADALDLVTQAMEHRADLVLLPAERLPDEFFTLRTGLAGAVVQKLVNYGLRLAVVGDIADHLARSTALRDFVGEANRSRQVWFVATREELAERLRRQADGRSARMPHR